MNDRHEINKEFLKASIDEVRYFLESRINGVSLSEKDLEGYKKKLSDSALDHFCEVFSLSKFERNILLLCAGMELEGDFGKLCAKINNDDKKTYPTLGLCLSVLPDAHWSAVTPEYPLRYWELIKIEEEDGSLVHSRIYIDEFVLHYIIGISSLDKRLHKLVTRLNSQDSLVSSHKRIADNILKTVKKCGGEKEEVPVIQLCGNDIFSIREIVCNVSDELCLSPWQIYGRFLPETPGDREFFLKLWSRDAALNGRLLLIEYMREQGFDHFSKDAFIIPIIENLRGFVIISAAEPVRLDNRRYLIFDVNKPFPEEQKSIWENCIKDTDYYDESGIESLISQFDLNAVDIKNSWTDAKRNIRENNAADNNGIDIIWNSCRKQARPKLDDLAARIDSGASWDDLALSDFQSCALKEIAVHVKHRANVYEKWGFSSKGKRGLGISALFAGPSGTGKTMAAEAIANSLKLDLYRIDLSSVVSKYIGETEKHLKRIFDAAEAGGAILLFDEADAIFGKRSEVKESHDRHANIEISYLLQKMESYKGLAILTTNMKEALDSAFIRRILFIVDFSFPDISMRKNIWERIFPRKTPIDGVDFEKLSKLSVSGGNIKNIALNAAFLAADDKTAVSMPHLLKAAKNEYEKMERNLTEKEITGWA